MRLGSRYRQVTKHLDGGFAGEPPAKGTVRRQDGAPTTQGFRAHTSARDAEFWQGEGGDLPAWRTERHPCRPVPFGLPRSFRRAQLRLGDYQGHRQGARRQYGADLLRFRQQDGTGSRHDRVAVGRAFENVRALDDSSAYLPTIIAAWLSNQTSATNMPRSIAS